MRSKNTKQIHKDDSESSMRHVSLKIAIKQD